jgi:hypothetical protein
MRTAWLQEIEEQALQAQRAAEGERKKLEDEVLVIIRDFNAQLQQLHCAKLRAQMALTIVEQQQLALAKALAESEDDDICAAASAATHEPLPEKLKATSGIVGELKGQSEKQLAEYAMCMHVSKALERGLQKAFPRLELQMPLILSIFRCSLSSRLLHLSYAVSPAGRACTCSLPTNSTKLIYEACMACTDKTGHHTEHTFKFNSCTGTCAACFHSISCFGP